jgi:Protein of unknown function (DUF3307)
VLLETAVALALGHVLADFTFQADAIVRNKHRPLVLFGHVAIVALAAWIALGAPLTPWPIALIAGSHLVIDALKLRFGGPGFRAFALDQGAHLVMIAATAIAFPATWAAGLWARPALQARLPLDALPEAMLLVAGLIAAVWAGGHAVGALMRGIQLPADPAADPSLPQGGRLIGQLERLMIYGLVLTGEVIGIGLLIAAKSLLRFGEIQSSGSRQIAEYVIIGTLASFAWALAISIAVARLLPLLS